MFSTSKSRIPEFFVTMLAVFAAFNLDRWREDRRLEDVTAASKVQIVEELHIVLLDLHEIAMDLDTFGLRARILAKSRDDAAFKHPLRFNRNFVSSAAIDVSLASLAAPYMDPEWLRRVATIYDAITTYETLFSDALKAYLPMATAEELQMDVFDIRSDYRPVYGYVAYLLLLNDQLQDAIGELLADTRVTDVGYERMKIALREAADFHQNNPRVRLAPEEWKYLRLHNLSSGDYCIVISAQDGQQRRQRQQQDDDLDGDLDPVGYLFREVIRRRLSRVPFDQTRNIQGVAYNDDFRRSKDAVLCFQSEANGTYYLLLTEHYGEPGDFDVAIHSRRPPE